MSDNIREHSGRLLSLDDTTAHILSGGEVHRFGLSDVSAACPGDFVSLRANGTLQVIQKYRPELFPTEGRDLSRFLSGSKWPALKRRARLMNQIRAFFDARGFLEVETPLLVSSPGTEVHLDAVQATVHPGPGQAPDKQFLITSPEQHMKRLLSAGSGPIYQLAKVFRDGERGAHHRVEFTMLEWYRPFATYETLMDDCEELISHMADALEIEYRGQLISLERPWPRLTFREALQEVAGVEPETLSLDEQLECMVSQVEPALNPARPHFITEFPIGLASLARPKPGDSSVAERFELFAGGLELANAFGELTDPETQRARCDDEIAVRGQQGKTYQPIDEEFIGALDEGCPPSSGIALGVDRLIMLLTNSETIDDVLAF